MVKYNPYDEEFNTFIDGFMNSQEKPVLDAMDKEVFEEILKNNPDMEREKALKMTYGEFLDYWDRFEPDEE